MVFITKGPFCTTGSPMGRACKMQDLARGGPIFERCGRIGAKMHGALGRDRAAVHAQPVAEEEIRHATGSRRASPATRIRPPAPSAKSKSGHRSPSAQPMIWAAARGRARCEVPRDHGHHGSAPRRVEHRRPRDAWFHSIAKCGVDHFVGAGKIQPDLE